MSTPSSDFRFGQARSTERGVELIVPHQRALQVAHLDEGVVTISVIETGRDSIVFTLSRAQADALALLLAGHDRGRPPLT
jgi:hypothetical protein